MRGYSSDRQVVAHPLDHDQLCVGDRGRGGAAAGRVDHPVLIAVHHHRRRRDPPELGRPVTGLHDRRHLAAGPGGGVGIAVIAAHGAVADVGLVERESARADVAEQDRGAVGGLVAILRPGTPHHPQRRRGDPAGPAGARGGHDRDEAADVIRVARRQGLGDHPAHRDADDVRRREPQGVEQARGVPRHVAEVVLLRVKAPGGELGHPRRSRRGVGRAADVAVVEPDRGKAAGDQRVAERIRPRQQLLAEAHDQQHRRVRRRAEALVAETHASADVDELLARTHAAIGSRTGAVRRRSTS